MAVSPLRFLPRRGAALRIDGDGVYLRFPSRRDYAMWSQVRGSSRRFLEPWEPVWSHDDLTRQSFSRRIDRYQQDYREGRAVPLFLFLSGSNQLVGGLNIGNIRRAAAQSCMIGYWMSEDSAGKGLMLAGLKAAIPYIFETLQLHRIEAACIPENNRSVRLLEKANFQYEGYLRGYLKINGKWRDHHLYALLSDDVARDGPATAKTKENTGS
ncbi:GNAT family protein [Nitratireductor sp. XY-223]|uniref:GNAT family N-acetyltransferase n=1 Tax=Nitratireductor sp. XY-223 TaxID=2561926 RepID=UPI0010A9D30B|nr:GNAT family protein [Nitratireductor sp. XY-223]